MVARFAARFGDFSVAAETQALMRAMVRDGEVDALVAERVWQELSRGLMEQLPSRMLDVLHDCGALARLLPEVDVDWSAASLDAVPHAAPQAIELRRAIDLVARRGAPLAVRFAVLTHRVAHADTLAALSHRWRIPSDCREIAVGVLRERDAVRRSAAMDADALVCLLDRCDAWRRPERFGLLLQACDVLACAESQTGNAAQAMTQERGDIGTHAQAQAQVQAHAHAHAEAIRPHRLHAALARAAAVDVGAVAQRATARGLHGPAIGHAVHAARVRAVDDDLADSDNEIND